MDTEEQTLGYVSRYVHICVLYAHTLTHTHTDEFTRTQLYFCLNRTDIAGKQTMADRTIVDGGRVDSNTYLLTPLPPSLSLPLFDATLFWSLTV